MRLSVVIPAYKNTDLFLKILRNNIAFLHGNEIIVVNDDPSQSIAKELGKFKQIKLIENEKNLGFGQTVNKGVKNASGDYVLLLNTDVKLSDFSFKKAVKQLQGDKKLFAVSFAQKEKDGTIVGKNKIYWRKGYFQHKRAEDMNSGWNGWAEGGSSVFDKKKFLDLDGFDPLYSPFYWEDIDLSFRAWKAGYKVLFDSSILVEHHHESTIGKYFKNDMVKGISYRNQLFFIWKNMETGFLVNHLLHLCKDSFIYAILGKNKPFTNGLLQGLKRLPEVSKQRAETQKKQRLRDKDILKLFYE